MKPSAPKSLFNCALSILNCSFRCHSRSRSFLPIRAKCGTLNSLCSEYLDFRIHISLHLTSVSKNTVLQCSKGCNISNTVRSLLLQITNLSSNQARDYQAVRITNLTPFSPSNPNCWEVIYVTIIFLIHQQMKAGV